MSITVMKQARRALHIGTIEDVIAARDALDKAIAEAEKQRSANEHLEPVPKPDDGFEGSIRMFLKKADGQWERLHTLEQSNEYMRQQFAQRQPLTDEQIMRAWEEALSKSKEAALYERMVHLVRAIEAAHGIGEKK